MKNKQVFNILLIFTTVIILLAIGITITLIFRESLQQITYDTAFGSLDSPIDANITTSIDIEIKTTTENLTTANNVYKIDSENDYFPSKSLTDKVAKNLKIKDKYAKGDIYLYDDQAQKASIEYSDDTKSITLDYFIQIPKGKMPGQKDAEIIAKDKLEKAVLWPFEDEYTVNYRYYVVAGNNYYESQDESNASLIGIVFTTTYENIPVIASRANSGEIEVLINSNQEIVKIIYAYRPTVKDEVATYPIDTTDQAFTNIGARNAELVLEFEATYPGKVEVGTIKFAYRVEKKDQKFLQPVYVFEGFDEDESLVTLIVPAVRSEYLRSNDQ